MNGSNSIPSPEKTGAELWQPGHLLMGRFEIRAIKSGSMGLIYFCQHLGNIVTPFVIKTLPRHLLLDHRELFLQEISTWVALGSHPYIVHAFGAHDVEERACLFLEYVAGDVRHGSDLSGWIGTPELDLKCALTFGWQICAGMRHASKKFEREGKSFVHRDLKPANLLVTSREQIKISDFGIAVFRDLAQTGLPRNTPGFGNRVYMSPEQCRGDLGLDVRSDIYSFGCVVYEMLTGTTVFSVPRTSPDYSSAHLSERPRDPRAINSAIPPTLDALVMKCLLKEPGDRYPHFSALQEEIGLIYEELYSESPRESSSSPVNGKHAALASAITSDLLGETTKALSTIAALDVTQPDETGETAAIFKSEMLAKAGRDREGIELLDSLLTERPDNSRLWNQKGRLLINLGCWEDALKSFDRACDLDPINSAIPLNNKAYALLQLDRPEEALQSLESCLRLNRRLAGAWNNKGRALAALEQWEEASASYAESVKSNEIEAEVWFNWSVAEVSLGRIDSAKAKLRQCLIVDVLHWKALRNLAILLQETRQTEDDLLAVEDALDAQKAFARDHPHNLDFRMELVITLLALARETEARVLANSNEDKRS